MFEGELALKDVALGESPLALEIEGGEDLAVKNDVLDVWRVLRECADDRLAECVLVLVPGSFLEVIGSVLHEARHHVFAWWCD